jgi:hypothetical protein
VATKDQAYALFLLGLPIALTVWLLDRRLPDREGFAGRVLKETALGVVAGALLLMAIDGAFANPAGFADRARVLLGPASQDHANYAATWAGRAYVLRDVLRGLGRCYPWPFAPVALLGTWVVLAHATDRSRRAAALTPLFWAASFTLAFNLAARRTEDRFVLPQSLLLGVYAGIGFDWLHERSTGPRGRWFWGLVAPCFAIGLFGCAAVDAAMVLDPRYDAEQWLHAHVRPSDSMEVYGNNVHLPRLTSFPNVSRVDPSPVSTRSPMPGLIEVSDRFSNVDMRRPRFIVVSEFWAEKYLVPAVELRHGDHVLSPEQQRMQQDLDSRAFFRALRDERLAYRLAHASNWDSEVWPQLDFHASLGRSTWIFERVW